VSAPKLDPERAALVVIDVQEGFRKAVPPFDQVARATAALVRGAKAVGIPIVVTEQYPKGLGSTVPEVANELPESVTPIEKVCFSAPEAEGFDLAGRDQALVCGIEAHVCVNQTTLDLLDQGVEVQVVRDAVGSRFDENREIGLARAERAGAVITSVETALFELVGRAGTDEFKQVHEIVLDYAPSPS
jgi:nicotinamidase-related amidase